MAYTTAQLVSAYTNANLGKAPDAATNLTLDAYASQSQSGGITDAVALANTLKLVNGTTAVAVETYQFFTGRAPSAAGLAYLVNSATNTSDLNDAYYTKFGQENRFINFSINLATGAGEGAGAFALAYGTGVSYGQVVATAYDKIIGNATATAAGVDVAAAVAYLSRQANIDYLTAFVKAATGYTAAADIDLAVKAALIGEILNVATVSGLGAYAGSTAALITDLSDGTLSTDSAAGVNILTAYPSAGNKGTTYTLITGADTIVGTGGNDTFNALSIKADGTAGTTFSSFDNIDGGAGVDTLNIYTTAADNNAFPTSGVVKNVEIVNVLNTVAGVATLANAAKYDGIQELWQVGFAANVTGLANGVTAGFKDITTGATVTTNTTATSAKIALSNQKESQTFIADGSANKALAGVILSGSVADNDGDGVVNTNLTFKVGVDVTAVTVGSAISTTLTVDDSASTAKVTSVDLSSSTGAVTYAAAATVKTITGGTGADVLTIATVTAKDNVATAADETVTATVSSGAGNDTVTVNTTGDGLTSVTTGAGNDTVAITGHGTGVLKVDLGEGTDSFTSAVAITAADSIDAGAGSDTLLLSLVGVANVGAFKNFDVFDVKGLATSLDLDILTTNNTVTELVGSGALGGAVTLSNVGTGVNFRATADMGATVLSLTQKTAGALTVTLDADQKGTENAADDTATVSVSATNATSVSAVFDTSYLNVAGSKAGETAATDNVSTINLTTAAATSVSVVSGGANSQNVLNISEPAAAASDKLTTVTITGASALTLTATGASKLATVDASAATGGLVASTADLANNGLIKLGSGVDTITATNTSTFDTVGHVNNAESITGFEKTLAVSVSVVAGDAVAKAAAIADADSLLLAGGTVANLQGGAVTTGTIANGVLTFTGAGPGTLEAAVLIADAAAETAGEVVVFQYLNDSYVFSQGAVTDTLVKLVGVTGVTNLVENGATDKFFIV
jgi:S-layer protein